MPENAAVSANVLSRLKQDVTALTNGTEKARVRGEQVMINVDSLDLEQIDYLLEIRPAEYETIIKRSGKGLKIIYRPENEGDE